MEEDLNGVGPQFQTLVQDAGVTIASYTYDALDRRITKTVGTKTTRYVYAGSWIIEEYVTDGAPEAKVAEYYHGSGMDDVVMTRRTDVNDLDGDGLTGDLIDLYMHKNMGGSTMVVTRGNGMPVEFITYDGLNPVARGAAHPKWWTTV